MGSCYMISKDVITRAIEDKLIIIPIISGVGDIDQGIFTLNETGRVLWNCLDGKKTLQEIIQILHSEYGASLEIIEKDVITLVNEFLEKSMVVAVE